MNSRTVGPYELPTPQTSDFGTFKSEGERFMNCSDFADGLCTIRFRNELRDETETERKS